MEAVEDRAAYADRRRSEAEQAAAVLGVAGCKFLGLPDGELQFHREAMVETLSRLLSELRPGWLLAPGPLEVTRDHQAAFAAVFDLLHPMRATDSGWDQVASLGILLYEINHPAYPNLLIDVSGEVEVIERAMAAYPSQQDRHDYLAAGLGLRRYRTHTLAPGVVAAEAYTRLTIEDFTQRDRGSLISRLGGSPSIVEVSEGPTVSVVVRTCERPELLAEALASIAASSYRRLEVVLVVDGAGAAPVDEEFPLPVVRVELDPRRGRSGAANAGVAAATGDFVAFLDDDDLVSREHFAVLAHAASAAGVRVVYSDAAVVALDLEGGNGWREVERRLPYSRDFDPDLLLVDNYIPLNTLLIDRELFGLVGPFDTNLNFFEDWDFLIRLSQETSFHHLSRVTCEYRHFRGGGHVLGERPRERPDFLLMKERIVDRYRSLLTAGALARVVDRLRGEAVDGAEAARSWRRDRDAARQELEAVRGDFHRVNGEVVGLRQGLEEQEDHLRRLYAELERLGGVIEAMQGTRAWRFHEWWQRRRS
jgi:LmbE family N-acetylglucosaminyl deacetylase/glycosyltransferase involved in cell wall biosynthesis